MGPLFKYGYIFSLTSKILASNPTPAFLSDLPIWRTAALEQELSASVRVDKPYHIKKSKPKLHKEYN